MQHLLLLELIVAEDGEALLRLLRGETLPVTSQIFKHFLQWNVLLQMPPSNDSSQTVLKNEHNNGRDQREKAIFLENEKKKKYQINSFLEQSLHINTLFETFFVSHPLPSSLLQPKSRLSLSPPLLTFQTSAVAPQTRRRTRPRVKIG